MEIGKECLDQGANLGCIVAFPFQGGNFFSKNEDCSIERSPKGKQARNAHQIQFNYCSFERI